MAGIKGGPQQCLTPVVHTLGKGPAAELGAGKATHSPWTSPAPHTERQFELRRENKNGGDKRVAP